MSLTATLAALALVTAGQPAAIADVTKLCADLASIGESVMIGRQMGVPAGEMKAWALSTEDKRLRRVVNQIIDDAHREPQHMDDEKQLRRALQFGRGVYAKCMQVGG